MTDMERLQRMTDLMTCYGTDIERFCLLQLRDAGQAEDAAQETFIKGWRANDAFRGDSSEKTGFFGSPRIHAGTISVRDGSGSWIAA